MQQTSPPFLSISDHLPDKPAIEECEAKQSVWTYSASVAKSNPASLYLGPN